MAELIEMPFGFWMSPRNCVKWVRAIFGERGTHCKVQWLSAVSCENMAEPVDLPFGLWTRVGQRMHKFSRIHQVVPMCPHGRAHWHHLATMIELSMCGGKVALCQITFTTWYYYYLPFLCFAPWFWYQKPKAEWRKDEVLWAIRLVGKWRPSSCTKILFCISYSRGFKMAKWLTPVHRANDCKMSVFTCVCFVDVRDLELCRTFQTGRQFRHDLSETRSCHGVTCRRTE